MRIEETLREEVVKGAPEVVDDAIRKVRSAFDAAWMDDFSVNGTTLEEVLRELGSVFSDYVLRVMAVLARREMQILSLESEIRRML